MGEYDWIGFVVLGLGVVAILACAFVFGTVVPAHNECRAAGYARFTRFAGERWCIGIVDGEGQVQRLEEIREAE